MHEELRRLGNHDLLERYRIAAHERKATAALVAHLAGRSSGAERDGMRCTFVSDDGHRCQARQRLQYHHDRAFALGGQPKHSSRDQLRD